MPRDFLSGLIGRAFEQVPVLERRRPSLFEPESGRTGPSGEWSERVEEAVTSNRGPVAKGTEAVEDWKPQPKQMRATQHSLEEDQSFTQPVANQPTAMVAPAAVETARLSESRVDYGERARMEQHPASVRIERITEHHLEMRQSVIEHREVQVERARTQEPAKDKFPSSPLREVIHIREEAARSGQQKHPQNDTPPSRPEPKRADALSPPPPATRTPLRARTAPETPAPPVPTIQVTIGRVELRSQQPLSAAKPSIARARVPKLGLDAYLRQREGGVQ